MIILESGDLILESAEKEKAKATYGRIGMSELAQLERRDGKMMLRAVRCSL